MNNLKKLKRLIKISQEANTELWEQLKAEVENEALPVGLVDVAAVEESAKDAESLMSSAKNAETALNSISDEEKKELGSSLFDPTFWDMASKASGGNVTTSSIIDTLFIKMAGEKIGKANAAWLIREINLYNSMNPVQIKIASRNSLESSLISKVASFESMIADSSFLTEVNIKKAASINKRADLLGSVWDGAKNLGSGLLKGIKSVGRYTFKFIGTVLPFLGLFWNAKAAYNSFMNVRNSMAKVKEYFSDFGKDDSILDAKYISGLISANKNDPEKLIKIAQLNKIGKFYQENWYRQWSSVLMFISDLIFSIGIVATAVGTGGVGAAIMLPLVEMTEAVLGKAAVKWAFALCLTGLGDLGMTFFDLGLGGYEDNKKQLLQLADSNISTSVESGTNSEEDEQSAMSAFEELQRNMATA